MKSIKIFFLATVAIVAGLFTACSDDDFKAGPEVDGAQVYFPENVTTQHSISDDVSSIAIPVKRIAKDEALTVAVLASDESGLFTIPSSVSFAAGKETSELLITFDRTKLEDGKEYPLSFLINDEDNTTPYGNRSLDITVMPWPWVKMGTGKFREGWLSDVFTGNMFEIDVTVHSHKSKEGIYMSSNYDPAGTYIYTWWSYVDPEGDATNDPLVFKVDASTKQLSELNTYLHCPILDANDAYVGDLCFFPIGTAVTAYTANGANSAAKVQGIRTRVPFSSVRVPANAKFRFENRIDATTVKTVNANVFANGVRTLSVKTAKCEPLPKQIGRRADFKIRENLPVLK